MTWATFYGILAVTTVLIAWRSGHTPTLKFALLLLAEWVVSNVAVSYLGFIHAPGVLPEVDAILAIVLGAVAFSAQSRVGLVIFTLYLAAAVVHVLAYIGHTQGSTNYYIVLNGGYAVRAVIVGASGVQQGVARWSRGGSFGPHHTPARSPGAMAGVARWPT